MSGRQSGYIKNNKYFKYGKSVVSETTSIISQTMNERDKLRIFGKALPPVVKPVVKPVTDKTIKINQNFSLSRTIPKRIFFYCLIFRKAYVYSFDKRMAHKFTVYAVPFIKLFLKFKKYNYLFDAFFYDLYSVFTPRPDLRAYIVYDRY